MDHALEQLAGKLLIQCRPSQLDAVLELGREHDTGIVLTSTAPEAAVRYLHDRQFTGPILCDADRYSGNRRISAGSGTHPAWCRRQRESGLLPLTDSGYLAPRNLTGLRTILRSAARQPEPAVAVLPLAARWFATAAIATALVTEINRHAVPVALVLEHGTDPFGTQFVVRGVIQLLEASVVPVLLLRCDLSAIGALCHSAHAAAMGTTSSLRHLYPIRAGRPHLVSGDSVFVPALLGYHKYETCRRIFTNTPAIDQLWPCACMVCEGRTPLELEHADEPKAAAFLHSAHCLLGLSAEIASHAATREQRISAWHEACSHALFVHDQVTESSVVLAKPRNLHAWTVVTADPLPWRERIPAQPVSESVPSTSR
ncbi:hypothetical protein [Amycolatopsis sp. NPDC051903]|uniref:hypothetical protein n=1 Tax=Amycolatopsis sp. NPDC051903 TaxID=3363936 RepID=UPI00378C48E2